MSRDGALDRAKKPEKKHLEDYQALQGAGNYALQADEQFDGAPEYGHWVVLGSSIVGVLLELWLMPSSEWKFPTMAATFVAGVGGSFLWWLRNND